MSKKPHPKSPSQPRNKVQGTDAAESFDFSSWAKDLIEGLPGNTPAEDLALLSGQVHALAKKTPTTINLPPDPTAPLIVRDRKALEQVAGTIKKESEVVIDLETSSLEPRVGEIVGVGLATASGNYYLPISHRFEETAQLRPDQLPLDVVVRDLNLEKLALIAHNAKFEYRWLRRHTGIALTFTWDTMIAARLLRADQSAELKEVAVRELDVPDWEMTKTDIKRIQTLPIERVARYCAKDCYYTLELYRRQRACLA